MIKKNSRFVMLAFLFNLTLLSYAAGSQGSDSGNSRPGGPDGSRDSRPEMPIPSVSELTIFRLQNLSGGNRETLDLDKDQAISIIPILEEWMETLSENPDSDSNEFVVRISKELTDEQNEFFPPPPGGMGRPQNSDRKQGGRPSEGSKPEAVDLTELIPELILILKEL